MLASELRRRMRTSAGIKGVAVAKQKSATVSGRASAGDVRGGGMTCMPEEMDIASS